MEIAFPLPFAARRGILLGVGQEIVYCFKCQKRILGTEISKGLAYQVENQMCCSTCVVLVLETLPPKAKEALLAKMFRESQERQAGSSGAVKALSGSSTRKIPTVAGNLSDRPAPADGSSSAPLVLGIGAAVFALIVAAVALSGGNSKTPAPPRERTVKLPPPPPPPPPDPGLSPEEKRRAETARDAMRKARDFAQANARDLEGQARQWRTALLEAERTGYEAEARREVEKAEARAREAFGKELEELGRQVRGPIGRREFKAAQALLEQARPRRSTGEWTSHVDRLQFELDNTAARAFGELKEKAIAARDRGAKAEVDAAKAEIARWGLPQYVADLETALAIAWRPIFDGKTTGFLNSDSAKDWRVVDGALTYVEGRQSQAAQSKETFGDGEFRFRVSIEGTSQFYVGVRQGGGSVRAVFKRTAALLTGQHELVFVCRGLEITATMDGTPLPLELPKEVHPKGRLQFSASDGVFRIHAVEFRSLP